MLASQILKPFLNSDVSEVLKVTLKVSYFYIILERFS